MGVPLAPPRTTTGIADGAAAFAVFTTDDPDPCNVAAAGGDDEDDDEPKEEPVTVLDATVADCGAAAAAVVADTCPFPCVSLGHSSGPLIDMK